CPAERADQPGAVTECNHSSRRPTSRQQYNGCEFGFARPYSESGVPPREIKMRSLIIFSLLSLFFSGDAFGREELLLARVTGYWRAEGCGRIAAWNGERLRSGHCAVDPRKIPYGSKVIFPDAECIAVDTGPA